jgi:hypothetical protein
MLSPGPSSTSLPQPNKIQPAPSIRTPGEFVCELKPSLFRAFEALARSR